jgi:hypothetical protein
MVTGKGGFEIEFKVRSYLIDGKIISIVFQIYKNDGKLNLLHFLIELFVSPMLNTVIKQTKVNKNLT